MKTRHISLIGLLGLSMAVGYGQEAPDAPKVILGPYTRHSERPPESFKAILRDKQTLTELSLAGTALAGDLVTSRLIVANGGHETNPLMRPFVKSNGMAAGLWAGDLAGMVLADRLLWNHPRWRHIYNWSVIGIETGFTVFNAHALQSRQSPIVHLSGPCLSACLTH